ncbi:hypothetical protein BT93_L0568 [Corymbia citriodora subsp. variegata]|uniref:Glycosyltransferase n=1 Tax=Corymbia citriodora subsp. variegata TaxID=360336 RepID=A0A8T0CPK2_CORYI|nr:hypothetical protein BT93_L0568 [Corymbia citriodora subsp. variegata]
MGSGETPPTKLRHVLALPFPRRGHINPIMNFCRSLLSKIPDHHVLVSFVVTEEWLGFIGSEPKPGNVRFVTVPNVVRSEVGHEVDSPRFYEEVLKELEAPVERLLDGLEPPVTAIVADTFLVWSVRMGRERNIPVAAFFPMSATMYSVKHHFDLLFRNGHYPADLKEKGDEVVDYIPGVPPILIRDLPTCFYGKGLRVLHHALEGIAAVLKAQSLILVSVYELEHTVIDALRRDIPIPIYHVGPTIPHFNLGHGSPTTSSTAHDANYWQWLDSQPDRSVLYVSQGSLHSASKIQIDEIIAGLRMSGVRYFWVGREQTPQIKEEFGENEEMGLVVPWCEQLSVLCHASVGGFCTHCGWSSTFEAVFAGLPMLTFPIYWDQVSNSKLVVEDWRIGWRIKRKEGVEYVVPREEIAGLVRRFMDPEDEEAKAMRRRAKELQEITRNAVLKGGSSDSSIDAFLHNLLH